MRVLVDYRPALKERTGVGEYVHQFVRALLRGFSRQDLELSLISSSWKDRFQPAAEIDGATAIDRRVPGKLLNLAWHRLGWPLAELLAGRAFDVTQGDAGPLVDPEANGALAAAIERLLYDEAFAAACVTKGTARSRRFSWDEMARGLYAAYRRAIERRCASA